jgi:hypothetical protein
LSVAACARYDHASIEVTRAPTRHQALTVVTDIVAEQMGMQVQDVGEADNLIADGYPTEPPETEP